MSDQSPEALLVAVLDPNRAVESRYVAYSAVTKSGDVFTGVLADESATSVLLRDSGGKEQRVPRSELASLKSSAKSLMTEGLESEATPQDFADLIAFLRDDARPGKRVDGNSPALVQPMGECGALHLTAATAEIYGPRLTFEPRYHNLGWWQNSDDFAAWTLEPARAGEYDVVLEFACDASGAGGRLKIEAGGAQLEFDVPSTGSWDDYREQTIGTISLTAGLQRLVAKPAAPPKSALIDLREIRLTPKQ
jgi:putative heme-binding domain-containing protein